ncbi:MAG: (Dimethylallyl)adenosine tRNA methylthiotransferase MiaB, partial [Parcubacteria group bacterium GW2011_GWC2_42_6]
MKKCRCFVSIRDMKYHIITYGCQMNTSDTERLATKLKQAGHQPAKNSIAAELILINACSVRQSAINRVFSQIENRKNKKIIIAGCVLENDKKKISDKYKDILFWNPNEYFCLPPTHNSLFRAYVPIMTGCNNFCSYCVVPYTRGREQSRPVNEIITEIKSLIKKDYKEITLLGQNVNSYSYNKRLPLERSKQKQAKLKTINFIDLLKQINSLPGNFRLIFLTSHPKDMSSGLIEAIAKCKKVSPYIHLPIQSGDNIILRKMNRRYTAIHYKNLIKKLRAAFKKYRPAFPPLAISTDVIVGFPGETKKQFLNTAKLMREIKFDMAYLARYSPRARTAAACLKDDISPAEKKRRENILNDILAKTALINNKKYI